MCYYCSVNKYNIKKQNINYKKYIFIKCTKKGQIKENYKEMNENMLHEIGARIQKLREDKGITQAQLADELYNGISKIEPVKRPF